MRFAILLCAAVLAGCATSTPVRVQDRWVEGASLQGRKSYSLLKSELGLRDSPLANASVMHETIRDQIGRSLDGKGYQRTSGKPAFYVAYHTIMKDGETIQANPAFANAGLRAEGQPGGLLEVAKQQHRAGSIVIDLLDGNTRQLLWRGVGFAPLREKVSAETRQAAIRTAVGEILGRLPAAQ